MPPIHAPSLEVWARWSALVQLHGNLELALDPTRTPLRTTLFFAWYRTTSTPADRIGITIQEDYQEARVGPECGTIACTVQFLAVATPPDGCKANELPSDGACVAFVTRGSE